jgi:hypothetical protein
MDQVTQTRNRQAVEAKKPWALLWTFVAIALLELYSLFPGEKHQIEKPMFWLDPTLISFQTWVDYAATRASICVFLFILRENLPEYRAELNVLFWLMVGYLLDYFVIYNNHFAKIGFVPISYTSFMLILAAITVGKTFQRSWR